MCASVGNKRGFSSGVSCRFLLSVAEFVCVTHELKDFHEIRDELHSVERNLLRFKHSSLNNKKERLGITAIKRFVGFS